MIQNQSEKKNVLLICVDHWGGEMLRAAGHPTIMTPTIDQLCKTGVRFSNAYAEVPVCIGARRSLMTGLTARTHGDRSFNETLRMPDVPSLAQTFRNNGYQAFTVGKLHAYPQRDRIGFDEVISNEEGRHHLGAGADDWELYLAEQGYGGQEYAAGLCNNDYLTRSWHLPEHCHPTNWAAREMSKMIHRRDPQKPGFWYLSFVGPHQPVWPLQTYMDMYRDVPMDDPVIGEWCPTFEDLPFKAKMYSGKMSMVGAPKHEVDLARRAFYATITHIDHQIRVVIGTLREEGLLENTIIGFIADHGDMLGDHHQWAKGVMYDRSNKIPLVFNCPSYDGLSWEANSTDERLVGLHDVMPTLLDLCDIDIPVHVEGQSLLSGESRDYYYGEHGEGDVATRMIRGKRYKLIYYPEGNRIQLFDMLEDPRETKNLAGMDAHQIIQKELTEQLLGCLYGSDEEWIEKGQLVGLPQKDVDYIGSRALAAQRGIRFL